MIGETDAGSRRQVTGTMSDSDALALEHRYATRPAHHDRRRAVLDRAPDFAHVRARTATWPPPSPGCGRAWPPDRSAGVGPRGGRRRLRRRPPPPSDAGARPRHRSQRARPGPGHGDEGLRPGPALWRRSVEGSDGGPAAPRRELHHSVTTASGHRVGHASPRRKPPARRSRRRTPAAPGGCARRAPAARARRRGRRSAPPAAASPVLALQTARPPRRPRCRRRRAAPVPPPASSPPPPPLSELLVGAASAPLRGASTSIRPAGACEDATGRTVKDMFRCGGARGLARYRRAPRHGVEASGAHAGQRAQAGHGEGATTSCRARFALALAAAPRRLREVHRVTESWKRRPGPRPERRARRRPRPPAPAARRALWGAC